MANITKWGPKAEAFMGKETAEATGVVVYLFSEHRLKKHQYREVEKKLDSLGWVVILTPQRPRHGGTIVIVRKGVWG